MTEKELLLAVLREERNKLLVQAERLTYRLEGLNLAIDIVERVLKEKAEKHDRTEAARAVLTDLSVTA